ncbi:dockerin type I repeat-containing protein [Ruminococcus albus]|uniref:Dockerin domain-containing protein n=1 Tax=Ruminococcus albus TaxID=1264 RepID=A0A1I1QC13_RUMAL|nr:dockerin type I repeat-containing protein [Ruminococcus albus]SFD15660.1 hypothetical protein SAMN02910406_03254 [Ruminococcus albus]
MISKKFRMLTAFLAVSVFAAGTAVIPSSAVDHDVSNPARTINVRVNKPYMQYDIVSDELENANDIPLIIRDKDGKQVARSGMVNDLTNNTRHAYVTTIWEDHTLDFSTVKTAADMSSKMTNHTLQAIEPYYLEDYSENDPIDDLYYVNFEGTKHMPKYSDNDYYLSLDKDYYRIRRDTSGFEVVDTVTVPANKVFVDVDSKFVDLKDTYSSLRLSGRDEGLTSDYSNMFYPMYMYENAGKRVTFNADAGRHYVYAAGGNGGGDYLTVYDHETKYNKIKIKFLDAFPGFCDESLTWDNQFFERTYHIDMRGDQSVACFSALYHSGAAVSASIPDKDGYIYIWLKDDEPNASMEYNYSYNTGGGGGGSMKYMKFPETVDKIHSYFEYPTKRYCIYNLAPGEYTVEIDRNDLKEDYSILNSRFTLKNTQDIQSFDFRICSKSSMLGDVNFDGKVNISDIIKVAAHIKGKKLLGDDSFKRADINNDGKVNITDLVRVAAAVKGKKPL